ncbi:MAG: UDP-N-acetylmuramoyl-tripeptide--D-alanyl-D-alanine ligase [Alphaproteobacteria bacterium]|nr:UDP-N-acetylmuramoyl-tripeptide--D-alanyl-D-alanine ligase [Alphaproteobacteria bacterium]MDE2112717.1 UDP-N-acetylmuramoyl-tripeptide--D-alanyl-D-alanine ligase [Alphaproteobacteria bacterium]
MSTLWTSGEAEGATLGRASQPFAVTGLSLNSRTLKPGDLYVAIKGETRDGHDFVRAAFEAKAGAALVARRPDGVAEDAPLLTVANTQRALEDLARAARVRSDAKIVAVTGSAGKTTTKEMLKLAFAALGPTHVSGASFNNHWGVPLSMASLPRETAYGVFEIGMNHFGEIRSLVSLVRPHVALITTVAPAHLEFFGNTESIADAKSEIFESIVPGGAALIPSDSPYAERLFARARQFHVARVLTFGAKPGSDARLLSYEESAEGARVKAEVLGRPVDFRLAAVGRHIAANALGGLLSVAAADGDVLNAAAALKTFAALKGRGARFSAGGVRVIDESYNANPASMAAALALLGQAKSRRIAVLGDMLEMGPGAGAHHAGLVAPIDGAQVDLVFLCGPLMKSLWDALPAQRRAVYAPSSAELAAGLMSALREGDTVLVKGSNGIRMSVIIDALKARAG